MAFEGPASPTNGGRGGGGGVGAGPGGAGSGGGAGGGAGGGPPPTPGSLHRANSMLLDGLMSSDSYVEKMI